MKRSREDDGCSSQKTSYGIESQVHANENALPHERQASEQYLKAVEEVCYDRLDELRKLLLEFMNESIEVKDVIAKVKILFKDHPELIMAFNFFLPEGQKITGEDMVKDYRNGIPFEYVEATSFLNNIKIRFQEDENYVVYLSFLEILESYRDDNNFEKFYKDAKRYCFSEHPDLLKELTCFIPYSPPDEDTGIEVDRCKPKKYESSIEDDMNQLDVLVENLKSTRKCVDNLLDQLDGEPDKPICIKDHFSAIHLRCIEYVYGDGLDVIDVLYSNDAARALPIVQKRLIQKQEEWSTYRDEYFCRVRIKLC